MTGILAIETATDACSVAVLRGGEITQCYEVAPRQHSQLVFGMLRELFPHGKLQEHGIEAIAYGCGPGSFTGLRIAASAVQGLVYSCALPAIAVSTLAILAQGALRMTELRADQPVLCSLDARINEIYSAVYGYAEGLPVLLEGPWVCAPAALVCRGSDPLLMVGSGCQYMKQLPHSLRERISVSIPELLPAARDIFPQALAKLQSGDIQSPGQVQPVYVRDEISWKKLAQQGKRS